MFRRINNQRRFHASVSLMLIAAMLTLSSATAAFAHRQAQTQDDVASPLPDAGDVVAAYQLLRGWLDTMTTPPVDDPASSIEIGGATGVMVQVRRNGLVLGRGSSTQRDALIIRRAAAGAFGDLIGDPVVRDLPQEFRRTLGRDAILEMEVAGALEPLIVRTFRDAAARIRPGLDGFAIRHGKEWVYRFPSQAIDRSPVTYLPEVLVDMGINRAGRELEQLMREEGVSLYLFQTIHLTQFDAAAPPHPLYRGSTVVHSTDVDVDALRSTASGIVEHIRAHRWLHDPSSEVPPPTPLIVEQPTGLFGVYHPTRDVFNPSLADTFEQAITSYALSRYAQTPGIAAERAAEAALLARDILEELALVLQGVEPDPIDNLETCSMIVLAVAHLMNAPSPKVQALADKAAERVWASFDFQSRSFLPELDEQQRSTPLPAATRALIAAAMAKMFALAPEKVEAELVRAVLDEAWLGVAVHEQLELMPWIGWAEIDYEQNAGFGAPMSKAADDFMVDLAALLDLAQVRRSEPDVALDEIGGYRLTSEGGGRPEPTAQGLRPAAWRARRLAVVADRGQLLIELGQALEFARFTTQLSVRNDDLWAYRNPDRARGGIRDGLTRTSQSLPFQALALLTMSDIMIAVDRLENSSE
ncbi:MAG: hypothetical protein ACR2GY_12650 [Phycisphaerales bacterium]